jgi:tRNA(fMet)-specific endonuclease VapC
MGGKRFVLDTNIVIAFFKKDLAVTHLIEEADEIHLPHIVIGELYFGAEHSQHVESNKSKIEILSRSVSLLFPDIKTSKIYGSIKNSLRVHGTPIPENDIWIAAITIQHNLKLVTRDKHFSLVKGLQYQEL